MRKIIPWLCLIVPAIINGKKVEGTSVPLQLCCEPHHYFEEECHPSGEMLQPTFHDEKGVPIKHHLGVSNVTGFIECPTYLTPASNYKLFENGSIIVGTDAQGMYEVQSDSHCLIWINGSDGLAAGSLICFPEQENTEMSSLYLATNKIILPITMSISAFFLFITFMIYCLVPELQDLLGKSFMCSIFCLFLSKIFTVIVKSASNLLSPAGCLFAGVGMYTFFMQSFFWLNVISIMVFSSLWLRDSCHLSKKTSFVLGCVYAFGIPFLSLILILIYDLTDAFEQTTVPKPGFGVSRCWFLGRGAEFIYFYAPVGVLVCINIILFCLSACKICSIATRSSSSTFHFKNYLKLFLLMGVSWVFEVLSFFLMDKQGFYLIWFIFDMFNGLLGVFIFLVFACRKKLLKRAKERICGDSYKRERFPDSTIVEDSRQFSLTQDTNLTQSDKGRHMENKL